MSMTKGQQDALLSNLRKGINRQIMAVKESLGFKQQVIAAKENVLEDFFDANFIQRVKDLHEAERLLNLEEKRINEERSDIGDDLDKLVKEASTDALGILWDEAGLTRLYRYHRNGINDLEQFTDFVARKRVSELESNGDIVKWERLLEQLDTLVLMATSSTKMAQFLVDFHAKLAENGDAEVVAFVKDTFSYLFTDDNTD